MVRLRGRVLSATLFAAVLTLTGCQSRVGTNFGAPGLPTTVGPQTQAPAPAAPVAVPSAQATTVAGLARLAGVPMANASLTVENALTGSPMTLLLSDGREVAGMDASLTTDAEGRFSVRVLNLSADQVLRVVATSGDKKLSALVSGDGVSLSGYSILDTTFLVNVDEVSRAIDLVATGPLMLIANTLKPSAGADVRKALLNDLKATTAKLVEAAKTNGSLATLLNSFSTLKTPAEQAAAVKTALAAANLSTEVNALVASTMQATALQAQQAANLVENYTPAAFQGVQLVGTNFTVNLGTGNSLQIVNTATGQAINVTGGTGGTGGAGGSGGGGSSGGGGTTDLPFDPQIALATFVNAGDVLTLKVNVPNGDEEVETMAARVLKTDVLITGGIEGGTEAKLDDDANDSLIEVGGATSALDITQDALATTTVTLPSEFTADGTVTLLWRGFIKTDAGTRLGTFQVAEDQKYYYLLSAYEQPGGLEVKTARSSTLRVVNVLTPKVGQGNFSTRVVMVSRNATRVSRTPTVTYTP